MPRKPKIREGAYRCRSGFSTVHNGSKTVIPRGALVPYDVPYDLMDGREDLFENISQARPARTARPSQPPVEQATQAPGEVRNVTPPNEEDPDE